MIFADHVLSIKRRKDAEEDVIRAHKITYKIIKNSRYGYIGQPAPALIVITQAPVDGVMWYTVECTPAVAAELRQVGAENFVGKFYEHTSTLTDKFDISEDFYAFAQIKWGNQ